MPDKECRCSRLPDYEPDGVEIIKDLATDAHETMLRAHGEDGPIPELTAANAISYAFLVARRYPAWKQEIEDWLEANLCHHTEEWIEEFMDQRDWPKEGIDGPASG